MFKVWGTILNSSMIIFVASNWVISLKLRFISFVLCTELLKYAYWQILSFIRNKTMLWSKPYRFWPKKDGLYLYNTCFGENIEPAIGYWVCSFNAYISYWKVIMVLLIIFPLNNWVITWIYYSDTQHPSLYVYTF